MPPHFISLMKWGGIPLTPASGPLLLAASMRKDCFDEVLDGALRAAFFESAGSQGVVLGFHHHHPVSALFFGAIQGFVGKLDQSVRGAAAARQDEGRADADRQPAGHQGSFMRDVEFRYGTLN